MPIIDFNLPAPLSNLYTHQEAVSEILVLTNTKDNENIQLSNVRNHLNLSIAQIVELVGISHSPRYEIHLRACVEKQLHVSGLHWVNLDNGTFTPGFIASQGLRAINRVSINKQKDYTAFSTDALTFYSAESWYPMPYDPGLVGYGTRRAGNLTKLDISALTQLNSGADRNIQWDSSIAWTHSGNAIMLFIGNDIATFLQGIWATAEDDVTANPYAFPFADLTIHALRQPMLDDLLAPSISVTYKRNIDLPDEYMSLCIALAQHKVLEQINADPNDRSLVGQTIQTELSKIQANIQEKVQFEKLEREKKKYGDQR